MKQLTMATVEFEPYAKTTRRAMSLAEMERVVLWSALCALIRPILFEAAQRQIADLVDDQQLVDTDRAVHGFFPAALALRGLERHDQISRSSEAHLCPWQVAERNRQMRLADAGRAEEDDVLGTLDEGQAGSSWICWRGTPVEKPKLEPSSVLTVGKPATRANMSPARARRRATSLPGSQ